MLKKLFLSAAMVAFVFTACDSESSTSVKDDEHPQVNNTDQSGEENNNAAENNAAVNNDAGNSNASADVPCSVEKTSANSFVMKIDDGSSLSTVTTTIAGGQAEIDYVTVYDASVPETKIQALCEVNKQDALTKNATVTCEDHSMTIHEVEDAGMGFDDALKSAEDVCKTMNAYLSETSDTGATCSVTKDLSDYFQFAAVQPDSGTMYFSLEYKNGILLVTTEYVFENTVSQAEIDEFCAEVKAETLDLGDATGLETNVECDGRMVTQYVSEEVSAGEINRYFSETVADMKAYCKEIQRTGVIPDYI